jgi:hypothetical protein
MDRLFEFDNAEGAAQRLARQVEDAGGGYHQPTLENVNHLHYARCSCGTTSSPATTREDALIAHRAHLLARWRLLDLGKNGALADH